MSREAVLRCRCGEVEGRVTNASPETVNRIVCYCDDCQAFLHHLGRTDLLDAHGGTDIVQVAPATLSFHKGDDRIVGVRLSPKGLYRWYASCCKTPLGNTVTPGIPFVGIVAQGFQGDGHGPDEFFGAPVARILGKYAVGEPPAGSTSMQPSLFFRVARFLLSWKFGGKVWPHPFFDRKTGAPSRPVTVLSSEDRAALRPRCGPKPVVA